MNEILIIIIAIVFLICIVESFSIYNYYKEERIRTNKTKELVREFDENKTTIEEIVAKLTHFKNIKTILAKKL